MLFPQQVQAFTSYPGEVSSPVIYNKTPGLIGWRYILYHVLNCKQNPVQLATCTLKNIMLNYCLMINIVSFVIDLIIVLAPGDVAEHTGVDTGSLYGGVFAGIIILAFAIIIIALIIR